MRFVNSRSAWGYAAIISFLAATMAVAACSDDGDTSAGSTSGPAGQGGGDVAQGVGGAGAGGASTGGANAGGAGGGEEAKTFLESYPLLAEFPEGGIYDPAGHAFFVGSLADGSVHRIDAQTGKEETFFKESAPGAWWTLGMAVDAPRNRLWVCAMEDRRATMEDPPYDGYVWVFDLALGTRVAVIPLADAAPDATCTDVALTKDGTAYVTDRDFGNVYKVDIDAGPSLFVADAELESSIIGQNAVVVLPDESALLIAVYLPSRLVRVDLKDASVLDVTIDGSFADATFLAGADGMVYADGALHVAFTSELVTVSPVLADWSSVSAVEVTVPNGMTDVINTPNGLYLLNGQAVRYALGEAPDPFALVRFTK